jgi:hypothetical protein
MSEYIRQRDKEWSEHVARLAKERLKENVPLAIPEPDARPVVCERHSWRGPEQPSSSVVIETRAAEHLCPGCTLDAQRALSELDGKRPVVVLPPAEQNWHDPSPRAQDAYAKWLSDNAERLIREGKPHLVDPELADAAVARMNETHFAAEAEDALTDDEKRRTRRASYRRYWAKHIFDELPRSARRRGSDVKIEIGPDYEGPVTYRQGIAYVSSDRAYDDWEENWSRDDRSFVGRWLDERRRWSLPRSTTALSEDKADSLVEKIADAIRSIVSEPAVSQEDNNDAESVSGND